jgi:transposase-like protein
MQKHRTFKPEFKARVILQILTGEKSAAQICREHRLSDQLISNWKKQFLENADQIFDQVRDASVEQERIAELERMIGRLTMELEAAKKASLLLTPRSQRNGR